MAHAIRWLFVALLGVHGLIHLLGAAKGLGVTRVEQLSDPMGPVAGVMWLVTALVVLTVAAMVALDRPGWWWIAAVAAAVLSQVLVVTSWNDAKVGTVMNVVLVLAAVVGFAGSGPGSYDARWRTRVDAALAAAPSPSGMVTEADLDRVPAPLAKYLRRVGAVGRPRVTEFYAVLHGRIRSGPDSPWMRFTARQLNTFGHHPQRLFLLHATRSGLPVTVLHDYHDGSATMQGKVLSLIPVLDASGPEMDQGETVTVFNDMAVFAPAALLDARISWEPLGEHRVRGTLVNGDQTVEAELVFDASGDLVDFVSDDRFAASSDGSTFARQRWSTPLGGYARWSDRRVAAAGEGRWHPPAPGDGFTYIELQLDGITYNHGVPR